MSSTRRPPPRNTALRGHLERARLGLAAEGESSQPAAAEAGDGFDVDAAVTQLAGEFEQILGEDSGLDARFREELQAQFVAALRDAGAKQNELQVPDRAEWRDTVQALQDSGAVESDDANELLRRFEGAMQTFERRDSRIALEFARRLQSEGEEQALAWYRAQNAGDAAFDADAPQAPGGDVHPIRSEIVNSRARSPRGPPFRR
jgi:hypothetical protein